MRDIMVEGYKIVSGSDEMDLEAIHAFISSSYWANKIPFEVLQKGIENSLCFGVFTTLNEQLGEQVGFARVITDYSTFGYLADVFVLKPHRGKGLAKWLVQSIGEHSTLQGVCRMMLATQDAHSLYAAFGFHPLAEPAAFMEKRHLKLYED